MTGVGSVLVTEDPLYAADVIVVLMGGVPDRIVHAVELYRKGYGARIIMVRSRDFSNYEIIDALELDLPGMMDISRNIALQFGVPDASIVIIDDLADSTWDEALAIKEYMEQQGERSLILVTSKYHSARAKKTFSKVLGDGCRVISRPSPYDPFDPNDWWKDRRQSRNVFFEYQKLLNFYLFRI